MHIHEKELKAFTDNSMNTLDMIEFLEHLNTCDYCLEQLLQEETANCIQAPAYLKNQIIKKAAAPEIQASKAAVAASGRMRLFYHGLQTAFGILAALFLLFCSGNIEFPILQREIPIQKEYERNMELPDYRNHLYDFTKSVTTEITKGTNSFSEYLNEITNNVLNGGK